MLDGAFNFRESESTKKTPVGLFFVGSLLFPKKDKSIHRRARPSCRGRETSLPLVVQSGQKMLNLY